MPCLAVMGPALSAATPGAGRQADREAAARAFLAELVAQRFEAAAARFDEKMSEVMLAPKLAETWRAVVGQAGAFKEVKSVAPRRNRSRS
jgi:hypothetical protein